MRRAIAESLESRRLLTATPELILLPPRVQSVHAGVDAAFSLGRLKAIDATGPFEVEINWNDGSANVALSVAKSGPLPRYPQVFDITGIHIVDVSVSDSQGLAAAGEFKIRVLPATGGIVGTVSQDIIGSRKHPPLSGYTFYLDLNQDGQLDAGDPTAVSNARGVYRFAGVLPGTYRVEQFLGSNQIASPALGYDQIAVSTRIAKAEPFSDVLGAGAAVAANVSLTTVGTLNGPAQSKPSYLQFMQVDADGNIYAAADGFGPYGGGETLFRIPAGASNLVLPTGTDWFQEYSSPGDEPDTLGMELGGDGHLYLTNYRLFAAASTDTTYRYNVSDGSQDSNLNLQYTSLPIFDQAGNAYMTQENSSEIYIPEPGGSIIEIPFGTDTIDTIASFNSSTPMNLTQDAAGNLYGELIDNADADSGSALTLFKLASGSHAITTLCTFPANNAGDFQITDMISDSHGDLFGTTQDSNNSTGTVFELPAGSGTVIQIAGFTSVPNGDLTIDPSGDIFGEVYASGANQDGEVYEISAGTNQLSDIVEFSGSNGSNPDGLIVDTAGNLFGITTGGGIYNRGTAFKIAIGTLDFRTLVDFNTPGGYDPMFGLYADSSGNLYGATAMGGAYGAGTIFKISGAGFIPASRPPGAITGDVAAAGKPMSDVTVYIDSDDSGKLEPTDLFTTTDPNGDFTFEGLSPGSYILRVVPTPGYHVAEPTNSSFDLNVNNSTDSGEDFSLQYATLTTLAKFDGSNGDGPGDIITDAAGDLFGTTASGGTDNDGTVFELPAGSSVITTLANFAGTNGQTPDGSICRDSSGNIFGTCYSGGQYGDGTVFEIPAGQNTIVTLHNCSGSDGADVSSGLTADAAGNMYGTTSALSNSSGSDQTSGTVFKISVGSLAFNTLVVLSDISPAGAVVVDSKGNLFTSTYDYDLIELPAGSSTVKIINPAYSENGFRSGGIIEASDGNFYATTNFGQLYDIAPGTDTLSNLLLSSVDSDIGFPLPSDYTVVSVGIPAVDAAGNVFGTTGDQASDGIIYEIAAGTDVVSTLFSSTAISSADADGNLIADSHGDLFGTTTAGGSGDGSIFEIIGAGFVTSG